MRLTKRRQAVRLHLEHGPSIEGVLLGRSRGHYVVRAASVLRDAESSYEAGEVKVPVSRVLFYQVVSE